MNIIAMPVHGLNYATCGQIIERRLRALPGLLRVDASYVSQTVTISYDTGRMHEETICDLEGLGVLVAYLFSAFATLFAPQVEMSLDAAAMLVVFVLFGRWIEMRRRGSSDALNALLRR